MKNPFLVSFVHFALKTFRSRIYREVREEHQGRHLTAEAPRRGDTKGAGTYGPFPAEPQLGVLGLARDQHPEILNLGLATR